MIDRVYIVQSSDSRLRSRVVTVYTFASPLLLFQLNDLVRPQVELLDTLSLLRSKAGPLRLVDCRARHLSNQHLVSFGHLYLVLF